MGFLSRLLRREPAERGPRVRPEALRSVLLMADEGGPAPDGDPMELVMRVFHALNRDLFAAVIQRDLWEQIQLGFGSFRAGQRVDAGELAQLVRKSHGDDVSAFAQLVSHPLRAGEAPIELTLLTVYRLDKGQVAPAELAPTSGPVRPLLDLTNPNEGRAR